MHMQLADRWTPTRLSQMIYIYQFHLHLAEKNSRDNPFLPDLRMNAFLF